VRAALGERLERMGAGLWRGPLPAGLRARLIAWIMSTNRPGATMRRLAAGVAAGGARALAAQPAAALAMVAALEARGASPILIAGDSHSRLWVQRDRRGGRWLLPLHHLATGASARGLARTASRSGQGEVLRGLLGGLATARARLPVLLVFGQVDVEFVFAFKRLEQDPPADHDAGAFESFCQETAESYAAFAAGLPMAPAIALAAIFPPALSDEAWREGYLNAHIADQHTVVAPAGLRARLRVARIEPLRDRTLHHEQFNRALRRAAEARGLGWLDAFADLIGTDGVAEALGAAAGRDHHLDAAGVRPVAAARLWALIDAAPQTRPGHG